VNNGWIKLHRKLLENVVSSNPLQMALWCHLLLMASHDEREILFDGIIIKLKPGQFITGRATLSTQSGISQSSVQRLLSKWETEQQIEQQKTSKYRLITILKWVDYQIMDNTLDNRKTTDRQQKDTINNGNKDKNGNKTPKGVEAALLKIEEIPVIDKRQPQITEVVEYLKQRQNFTHLDGSAGWNRIYAKHIIGRFKGDLQLVKNFIDAALLNPFHVKNATSMKYLYNNINKIALEHKSNAERNINFDE